MRDAEDRLAPEDCRLIKGCRKGSYIQEGIRIPNDAFNKGNIQVEMVKSRVERLVRRMKVPIVKSGMHWRESNFNRRVDHFWHLAYELFKSRSIDGRALYKLKSCHGMSMAGVAFV